VDDRADSPALGGYPAAADRPDAKPLDGRLVPDGRGGTLVVGGGASVDDVLGAEDEEGALAAEDGVLQTESRDGESFDE
jgi:hypothetical protein